LIFPGFAYASEARATGVFARLGLVQAPPWLFAFAVVLVLAADSGGYWPTTWGWTHSSSDEGFNRRMREIVEEELAVAGGPHDFLGFPEVHG
jgi:hypothetical protein